MKYSKSQSSRNDILGVNQQKLLAKQLYVKDNCNAQFYFIDCAI